MINLHIVIALVPVVAFLTALALMDTFKLVRPRSILVAIAWGGVAAAAGFWLNGWLLTAHHVPPGIVSRYIAPFTEETANQIGRITTMGVITEFQIPTPTSRPIGITGGPDGNIWFTEFNENKIGRLTLPRASAIDSRVLPVVGST